MSSNDEELGYLSSARYGKDLVRVCRVVRHPATADGKPGKQEGASPSRRPLAAYRDPF